MASTARKLAATPTGTEKRRSARSALRHQVANVVFGGANHAATLHEISENGALVECPALLTSGDDIVIDALDGQHLSAKVIWTKSELFGCEFARSVSKAAISAALLKSAPVSGRPTVIVPASGDGVRFTPRLVAIGGLGLLAWAPVAIAAHAFFG